MEVYLNVAEWGDGIFGVEAAAQNRFGKSAKNLTQREASLLAAVLPSPNKWRVDPPTSFVQGRAGTLRQRMAVIRNSNYAACVLKGSAPQPVQREPVDKAPQETPQDVPATPNAEDNTESALEDLLDAAEESLNKDKDAMPPKPETPPVQVPVTDPTNVPTPEPSQIPPTISPDVPSETPQEVPIQSPPTEIPQRIDTPRIPPGP